MPVYTPPRCVPPMGSPIFIERWNWDFECSWVQYDSLVTVTRDAVIAYESDSEYINQFSAFNTEFIATPPPIVIVVDRDISTETETVVTQTSTFNAESWQAIYINSTMPLEHKGLLTQVRTINYENLI